MLSPRHGATQASSATWPWRFFGMLLFLLPASSVFGQANSTARPPASRADFERKRQELDAEFKRKQREFERSWNEKQNQPVPRSTLPTPASPARQPLRYRFPADRRFAYAVQIDWEQPGRAVRLVGQPYYHVHHQLGTNSTTLVVGRFRHFVRTAASKGEFLHNPALDYWLGTCMILGERGIEATPRKARGELDLPYLMTKIVTFPSLLTPRLPSIIGVTEGTSEPAMLLTTTAEHSIWTGFVAPSGAGRSFHFTKSAVSAANAVHLDIERGFEQEKGGISAVYTAQATFDLAEGLLRELQGSYRLKHPDGNVQAVVSVRLLTGEELVQAAQTMMQDMKALPKDHVPQELLRVPIELFLPASYGAADLPEPGTLVGYYDKAMQQRYQVKFIERVSPTEIKIRFEGSGETLLVHPGAITHLTSKKR